MLYSVVIVASGKGTRLNLGYNKVFYKLDQDTILDKSINLFKTDKDCNEIIVVTNKEDFNLLNYHDNLIIVEGGKLRQESVYNGLVKVTNDYVMIHDGARPYLTMNLINDLKEKLTHVDACILSVKAVDSIKLISDDRLNDIDRDTIRYAQTPQAFKTSVILNAYNNMDKNIEYTDDASIVEKVLKVPVYNVNGDYKNIKITNVSDLQKIKINE